MASEIDIECISLTASGDTLVFPVRNLFATARDEITALQEGVPTAQRYAFWFANLSGTLTGDGSWEKLTGSSGGMTGNAGAATTNGADLTLNVDAIVSVKAWVSFSPVQGLQVPAPDGEVAIQVTDAEGTAQRGNMQLQAGQSSVLTLYDGWLLAGASISIVVGSIAQTVNPASYVTVSIIPA